MEKPFWKSLSFWLIIIEIVGVVIDKMIAGGMLPNSGWAVIVSGTIGLLIKRGMVDAAVVKSAALVEVSKANPTQPPQG